ncbi:MAG: glycosyltransferase family 39 protein, partial [Anaerolineae bacterium]|nr:glycosyltransferase family 39 protein [Anaerolineae bacterium]
MSRTSVPSQALRWIWLGLLALAMGSRLLGLSTTPLSPDESGTALSAWDAVNTGAWPATADSPLLLTGQTLLFALLGPSEVAARLLPALAGVLIVGLPLLWRKSLGDLGALVAAGLLLASPLSLFTARRGDGTALAVLGGALIVTVILQTLAGTDGDTRGSEAMLALGLMLGLTGGPPFYDVAIAGCAACWVIHRAAPTGRTALRWKRAVVIGMGLGLL